MIHGGKVDVEVDGLGGEGVVQAVFFLGGLLLGVECVQEGYRQTVLCQEIGGSWSGEQLAVGVNDDSAE